MEFKKYQHVERFGTTEVEGIDLGKCYVFPKLDGTNGSIWKDEKGIQAGSRNRHLSLDNDNAGFYSWVLNNKNLELFFNTYPNLRLYGEFLVPHTLKTYNDNSWRNFYVFDVMEGENYLEYDTYSKILDEFSIEYIPPICIVSNPSYERLLNQLEKNSYLIKDGSGVGEGIVIKNYSFRNKFNRVVWAKIVRNEFKANHQKVQPTEIKEAKIIEEEIAKKYVTEVLINKEYSKITIENNGWSSKYIPRLLQTIFYCLVKEEIWNIVKDFKNPKIDFGRLNHFTIQQIKMNKPEIF